MGERFWRWVAIHAPRRLVKWCFVRVVEHAARDPAYDDRDVLKLSYGDIAESWERGY